MSNVFIALGGNIGDVRATFDSALAMLEKSCGVVCKSKLYQTPAMIEQGAEPQADYFNAVIHAVTTLPPADLLAELHRIEALHGRERKAHWGARTLDLDLLDYEGFISEDSRLTLPHPELAHRLFVLQPLHDVIPNWIHPISGKRLQDMLNAH
jgi:2-amino-4-hydroxy-6-hydroxymethyldihydropteridine diphosphokinase